MLVGVPGTKTCLVNVRLNNVRFSFVTDALVRAGPPGLSPPGGNVSTAAGHRPALAAHLLTWQRSTLQTAVRVHFVFICFVKSRFDAFST